MYGHTGHRKKTNRLTDPCKITTVVLKIQSPICSFNSTVFTQLSTALKYISAAFGAKKVNKCRGPGAAVIQGIPYIKLKKHYKAAPKQHWKFLFIKSDVLQFKVITFQRSP